MSTIAYAQFTSARARATPGTSSEQSPPGAGIYVDTLASLVPAEVLALHGAVLAVTTKTAAGVISIDAPTTLFWTFFGALALSWILYVVSRLLLGKWDQWDYLRMLFPPLAFVAWTMLQKATAFDAVCPSLGNAPRTAIAVFAAVGLGAASAALAYKADQKPV